MSTRSIGLSEELHDYLLDESLREPDVMRKLRAETARHPESNMQIAPEQGQFMQLLVRMLGARRALEVGVFTGYSALAVALALPEDGQLVACDISEEYTAVGKPYWEEAGVAHKIDLRIGPAIETLDALIEEGQQETFDFAFLDAAKDEYEDYYERSLQLIRTGGLIAVDNTLRDGKVADPQFTDVKTKATRAFNAKLRNDERVYLSLVPIADGLTLAMKRR